MKLRAVVVALCLWVAAVPNAAAPQRPASGTGRPPSSERRATLDRYCVTCHNQRSGPAASPRRARFFTRFRSSRRVGGGGPEAADRHHAAAGHAAARRRHGLPRWRLASRPSSTARRPRRPIPDGRCSAVSIAPSTRTSIRDLLALEVDVDVAAAAGRFGVRLRQQRRSARRVAVAARTLSHGRRSRQRAGGRRSRRRRRVARPTRVRGDQSQSQHSTGCRSAPSAASACATRFRSTASTSSGSRCSAPTSRRFAGSSIRISSRSRWTASACSSATVGGDAEAGQTGTITEGRMPPTRGCACACRSRPGRTWSRPTFVRKIAREHRTGCVRSSAATPAPTIRPAGRTSKSLTVTGPVQRRPAPATRRAAGGSLSASAGPSARKRHARTKRARARGGFSPRSRGAPIGGRSPTADLTPLLAFYRDGRTEGHVRDRHPARAAAPAGEPDVRLPRRGRSGGDRGRDAVPRQRRRAGVAAVVLPLEQHAGRRRCSTLRRGGPPARPGGARSSRCAACSPTRARTRSSRISPASGCTSATCRTSRPTPTSFPDFDNDLRDAFRRETELFFASIVREDRNVLDLLTADYTFVNERLAQALRHPERLRQPVPARRR